MRTMLAAIAVVAGPALLAGPALSQDRGGKKPPSGDCDLKNLEKAAWCEKCDKILEKGDIKDGKHAGDCDTKVKEIEQCLKKFYAAECHPAKTSDKPAS